MGESTNTFLLKYEKRAESRAEEAEVAAEPKRGELFRILIYDFIFILRIYQD